MSQSVPRLAASSYSNTAPLIWSFLYGSGRGTAELIMDTAPARSAEQLAEGRVNAALVPVFAYQTIDDIRLVPDVCVGARERVRSVLLVTKGNDLDTVRSVALDRSSRTSAALTRIIFREFFGLQAAYRDAAPDIDAMLEEADCALLIGDPALSLDEKKYRKFDIVEIWREFTGLGFVFAMWMTRDATNLPDLAAARDEGLANLTEISANYTRQIGLESADLVEYLRDDICYSVSDKMLAGMKLYFDLAFKNGLIRAKKDLDVVVA